MEGNEPPIPMTNLDFVVRFQPNQKISSSISIYRNTVDKNHIITRHQDNIAIYEANEDTRIIVLSSLRISDLNAVVYQIRNNPYC